MRFCETALDYSRETGKGQIDPEALKADWK
jgi:hypothetical protein